MNKLIKALCLWAFIAALLVTGWSCKKEKCQDPSNPTCENYDPCYSQKPITADFEMSQIYPFVFPKEVGQWHPDVAFGKGRIGFKAIGYDPKDTSIKYTWKLGAETIEGISFVRDFIDATEDIIPVTLIIEKTPDKKCFPNDDGRDTFTQYIKFWDRACDRLTTGDFKVKFEGETDSVIISTRNWKSNGGPINKGYIIIDTCSITGLYLIGFDRNKLQPDTTYSPVNAYQFYSTLYLMSGYDSAPHSFDKQIRVDPHTWMVSGEYFYLDGTGVATTAFKFNGRKVR